MHTLHFQLTFSFSLYAKAVLIESVIESPDWTAGLNRGIESVIIMANKLLT